MFATRIFAAALPPFLLLAGCASAPKSVTRPVEIEPPKSWTASAPSAPGSDAQPDAWLASFHDATLVSLVQEAMEHNYDLRAVAFTLESLKASARITGADRLPQLSLGADGARFQSAIENGSGGATSVTSENYGLGLDLNWELDLWGRLRSRQQAAIGDYQAAEADLAGARLSLAAAVARAWYRTTTAHLQFNLADETVRNFESTADLVRSRFEAGVSSSLELRLALANAASARALLDQRHQELDDSVRILEALLGRYPANSLETVETLPQLTTSVPVGLPSQLLTRRPDIIAAERRLAAADARVSESKRALLPSVRLTGSGGTASSELENLLDADFEVWSIAAGLTQPLFQGGRLRANVMRNSALAGRAHADYLATVIAAFREVESNLAAEETLRRREVSLREFAEHSSGAERLARDEYERGLSDIITVLESQRRALDARSSHLSIREQRLRNRIDLFLALGGGFSSPAPITSDTRTAAAVASNP